MDLLGSILGGMDSLPQKKTDEETKKRVQGNLIIRLRRIISDVKVKRTTRDKLPLHSARNIIFTFHQMIALQKL